MEEEEEEEEEGLLNRLSSHVIRGWFLGVILPRSAYAVVQIDSHVSQLVISDGLDGSS